MRTQQKPKSRRTPAHQERVQDLRNGSRTSPHHSDRDYRRKPKHNRWED